MKKLLKILALYGFFLPIVLDSIGFFLDPKKARYVAQYPFSYFFEQLLNGTFSVIPFLLLLLLIYNNILKKQQVDKDYLAHKIATLFTTLFVVFVLTLSNVIIFLYNYYSFSRRVWKAIAFHGLFPIDSAILVLIVYGLGLFIGWLIKMFHQKDKIH